MATAQCHFELPGTAQTKRQTFHVRFMGIIPSIDESHASRLQRIA
jgi:hypothetical protein